jgi:hypothetical protein
MQKQSSVLQATASIGPLLEKSIKTARPNKTAPNWRINDDNFVEKSPEHICEPGAVNFSSGWFGQGHVVSDSFFFYVMRAVLKPCRQNGTPYCLRSIFVRNFITDPHNLSKSQITWSVSLISPYP